jgi:hypothetical protein
MASQGDQTRADSGIELKTLLISALASAAAAYITSKIWAPGTLFSAAMSPVIVALVKEGLRKPTEVVANVVPAVVPASTRWSRSSASDPGLVVDPGPLPPDPAPHVDPDAPHVVLPPVVASDPGPVRVYSTRARRLRWRLALITGLLGFAICVVVFTLPELIAGESIGRSGHATTLWGGHRKHTKKSTTTTQTTTTSTSTSTSTATTPTTTDDTKTVTQTQTVTAPTQTTTTTPTTAAPATPAPSTAAPPATAVP